MSEYKGIEQMRALMRHAKLPKPMSQRSQREFPGNSLQHRSARNLIVKAQKIQASGDRLIKMMSGKRVGAVKGRNKPRSGAK